MVDINTGHKYIRVSDMKNGSVMLENVKFIEDDVYEKIKKYTISSSDVYITVAGTIGQVGSIPNELDGANLTENADKLIIYSIRKRWLMFVLSSCLVQHQIKEATTKVGQPKLAIIRIQNLKVPLVPLKEQKRIVARLEEILPLVDAYEKAYNELQELNKTFPVKLKNSLLQMAIEGKLVEQRPEDGNAADLLKKIKAEKAKLIKEKKIKKEKPLPEIRDDEIPFEIPDNWCWVRLRDVVYNRGQKKPENRFCYIDIGSINNKNQTIKGINNVVEAKDAPSRARKIVGLGDILYATVRPYLHNMCIMDKNFEYEPIASTGFAVMTCINNCFNKYLFWYLLSPAFDNYANANENSKGVAYPAINDERLYKAVVSLPPLAEQKRIVAKLEQLLPLCDELMKHG